MKRLNLAAFGVFLAAFVTSGLGCELLTAPDRSKIGEGGSGGTTTSGGSGGVGGTTTSGGTGGVGGTTSSGGTGGTTGTPCTTVADCGPAPGACIDNTCENDVCGTAPKAAGAPAATQTDGDCKVSQCDGAGVASDVIDNADVPVDGEDCTDDVCTAGEPTNPPTVAEAACGVGGLLKCDGLGSCVDCTAAIDCGIDSECQKHTCTAGVCGVINTAQGTAIAVQTDGNCKIDQCDGMGAVETVDDNADVLVDATACTSDLCVAGVPSNPPVSANTVCSEGSGVQCDGNGACVECIAATDCAGVDDECKTRTCTAGVCGVSFTAVNTAVNSQTVKDCKKNVCNGAGAVVPANDDTDLPDDNNACTGDTCVSGTPTFANLGSGTACGATQVCDGGGQCVGCNAPADCPGVDDECKARTCVANVCGFSFTPVNTAVTAQTANDCKKNVCDGSGNTVNQNDNADLPVDDGNQCTAQACSNGVAAFPAVAADTACTQNGGSFCSAAGTCVACNAPAQCPGSDTECQARTCTANACGIAFQPNGFQTPTQVAGDCQVRQCNGAGAFVQATSNGDVPASDGNQCTAETCNAGAPAFPPVAVNTACTQNGGSFCSATGTCVACNAPAQCPGSDTECQTRTCNGNACGVSNTASGFVTVAQTAGDCQENQCNGNGAIVSVAKNTDLPASDGQDCTTEACTAGVPTHAPVAVNTACTQNGGSFCSAAGTCVACNAPAQCPGTDTECQVRTCLANACGVSNTASGFVTAAQTAGDCQENQCNGAGAIASVAKNTDLPASDGQDCTTEACTAGVPAHTPVALNTACTQNGGSFCSAAGTCVACNAPAQCPGTDTECQTRTCNGNACGVSNTTSGFVTAAQSAGDCQENQCNGSGAIVAVVKNTDVPVDSNQCTGDVCTAGVPSNPDLPVGTACNQNGGTSCNATGSCVSVSCSDNTKNGDETDIDCGGSCAPCANTKTCAVNGDCSSNICNGTTCVECVTPSTCPGSDTACQTRTCNGNACGLDFQPNGFVTASQTTGDCQENQCNGAGAIVSVAKNTDVPADDGFECTSEVCVAGVASHPNKIADTVCTQGGGSVCNGAGACVQCNTALQCPGTDTECQVRTCSVVGACGQNNTAIGFVTAVQTTGDCKQNECDGAGNIAAVNKDTDLPVDATLCTNNVCTAGVPSNPPVAAGTACSDNGGTSCDGAGVCVSPPAVASTTPADGAMAVASTTVAVTFTTAMNPATLTGQTIAGACSGSIQVSLDNFATCVAFSAAAATMSGGNTVATFTAAPGLLVNRTHKIRVTTAAVSASAIALPAQFTTATGFGTTSPDLCAGSVVISQVFGGGASSATVPNADYVELHNRGAGPVTMTSWSLQYASATGSTWSVASFSGTIPSGGYFLVRMQTPGGTGTALPTPDASGANINMAQGSGKVALVSNTTALTGTCPTGASIVDFYGYGTHVVATGCWEGAATAPLLTATTAGFRVQNACGDVNNNGADFTNTAPAPRNSATAVQTCACSAQNESNAALEADYCTVQFPLSLSVQTGVASALVYGQIFEAGVTEAAGANASVRAQLGYGLPSANPEYQGFTWSNATFNVQSGNNDEYQASFTAPAVGSYRYAYRFSVDNGVSWTVCDQNAGDGGAGSNVGLSFAFADEPVLTVTP